MSDMLKTVRSVVVILLEIKCTFAENREGQTDVTSIIEMIKETDAEVFSFGIFSCELLKNIYF